MKGSIRFKLLPIIIFGVTILAAIFYAISLKAQSSSLEIQALNGIKAAKETFYNLEKNDIKMLKSSITHFMENEKFKKVYLEGNRKKLYEYGQELFLKNKEIGITHFYFHRKNGTVFSRLHNKSKFDDKVTRKTFYKSSDTKVWGSGIELGKTAFALRVVSPYYKNNELIGYVEFGEEIDHFIEIMKEQTDHEYAVVVEKKYIDPEKWASVRSSKGLANNYNDLENYVIIDTTMKDPTLFKQHCFSQKDLDEASDQGNVFSAFDIGDKTFVGGGFSLYDAGNERVGAVVTIEDITAIEAFYQKASINMLTMTIVGALLICSIMVFMVTKVIIKPLDNVVDATTRVAGGDFSSKINVKSNDEIGLLAEMIEGFKEIMVNTAKELEETRKKP